MNVAAIADAIEYAVDNGAFVMNLSVNGGGSGPMAEAQRAAMDKVREANLLLVQSVSNFADDGPGDAANQFTYNLLGPDFANRDWFLAGIAFDANLNPREGNGTPGSLADRTLSVAGNGVLVAKPDGTFELESGNSFAAPAIAGAAALLKQYWPQLGGKEISRILLDSATDLGANGPDQIYGAGLLNVEAAMRPIDPAIGTSSVKASPVAGSSLLFSPAFGGAEGEMIWSRRAGQAVALDRYGRDYKLNMAALSAGIQSSGISIASLAMDHSVRHWEAPTETVATLNLRGSIDGPQPAPQTGHFGFRLSRDVAIAGAINVSIDRNPMMTGSMLRTSGVATHGSAFDLFAAGHRVSFGTARQEDGGVSSSTQQLSIQSSNGFTVGVSTNREIGAALGMRGTGAFNIVGSQSHFLMGGWRGKVGSAQLSIESLFGRTKVETRDALIAFAEPVISSGFRFSAEQNLFGGTALIGITSPLKVEHASVRYTIPVAYDPETRSLVEQTSIASLAPSARELNFETGWSHSFQHGHVALGAVYAVNSGNMSGRQSAAGWVRLFRHF